MKPFRSFQATVSTWCSCRSCSDLRLAIDMQAVVFLQLLYVCDADNQSLYTQSQGACTISAALGLVPELQDMLFPCLLQLKRN